MIEPCRCMCHAGGFCYGCECNVRKVQQAYQHVPDDSVCRDSGVKLPVKKTHDECNNPKCETCGNEIEISESTLELKRQISDIHQQIHNLQYQIARNHERQAGHIVANYNDQRDQIHVLEKKLEVIQPVVQTHVGCITQLAKKDNSLAERIEKLEKSLATHIQNRGCESTQQCNPVEDGAVGAMPMMHANLDVAEQPKKYGFTFLRAMKELNDGKKVRRKGWDKSADGFRKTDFDGGLYFKFEDFLSCDWEIAE